MLPANVACQVVVVQVAAQVVQVVVDVRFSRCCALPRALRC